MRFRYHSSWIVTIITFGLITNAFSQQQDIVKGNLIQFNDNGLWCWFQDERAIVDEYNQEIILGSDASQAGLGNAARNGAIEAVVFDLKSGQSERYELTQMSCDDHNVPGFILRPDGQYLAMYSHHTDRFKNRYRIFDGTEWSPEQAYDWTTRPGGTNFTIAYNNVYYLSEEGRMYDFTRANNRAPNFLISDDMGDTWTFGGQLTTNSSSSYNKGYYKYWSNGVDRIDFVLTEQHPRDTLTSIYHGYLQNGQLFQSDGSLVDDDIFDDSFIPAYWDFTKVFANGTVVGSDTLYRCWQSDLVRYENGTIATIITARANQWISYGYPDNQVNPEHDFIYCRYDGTEWTYTYLAKAGLKFYASEADYVGLGALDPDDPTTLYLSTPYDPADTSVYLGAREIYKGVTLDHGQTWLWEAITQNSTRDNIRPIVPAWNLYDTALLWCRGTYISAQSFDAAVVGTLEHVTEFLGPKTYLDADLTNTSYADSSPLTTTGPDSESGAMDNLWHLRTGIGNNGTILTSSELETGEDAPMLKTQVQLPHGLPYDVWVNFWGYADADINWRIQAGLSPDKMQTFRSMACKQVEAVDYEEVPLLTADDNICLYQAYLGRVREMRSIDVYVDDHAQEIGTRNPTQQGDVNRTWYDGISYAVVNDPSHVATQNPGPKDFTLNQNYPNPFNPETTIRYHLKRQSKVNLTIYNQLGQQICQLLNQVQMPGEYSIFWDGTNNQSLPVSSGIYIYSLKTEHGQDMKKMMLIR